MKKVRLIIVSVAAILLIVTSLSGMLYYYDAVLQKDSEISHLEAQINEKDIRIANLTSQVANLTSQLSDIENQLAGVKNQAFARANITSITYDTIYPSVVVGVSTIISFHVLVTNTGLVQMNNATVLIHNLAEHQVAKNEYTCEATIPYVLPNQSAQARCDLFVDLNHYFEARGLTYQVTLIYDEQVLAERYYSIN